MDHGSACNTEGLTELCRSSVSLRYKVAACCVLAEKHINPLNLTGNACKGFARPKGSAVCNALFCAFVDWKQDVLYPCALDKAMDSVQSVQRLA
eukprot:295125-Pelagomonas_calceolata.AAC.4